MKNVIFFIILIFLFSKQSFTQPLITKSLVEEIQNSEKSDSYIKTMILLRDQYDILKLDKELYLNGILPKERAKIVTEQLQQYAKIKQAGLLNYLHSFTKTQVKDICSFWIINMISIEAKPEIIIELAENQAIAKMDIDRKLVLEPADKIVPSTAKSPGAAESGLKVINAHELWNLGYTGNGRIVMNIDTGVDGVHPALGWRWRGNHVPDSVAWFDPVNGTTFPNDGSDHGTATMGIACGLDSSTHDTIGVAFGAEWIASNSLWGNPHTSYTIASFQWAMDPDGDPSSTDDMPDVINCSWYDPAVGFCDSIYAMVFNAVEAAGIAIVFSAGAGGPSSQSIPQPANINTSLVNTWATGAVDGNIAGFPIKSSSGRGPSQCYTGTSLDIKPEACAPGVDIRTSVNSGYYIYSGNSMATAHVSGAIVLLKEAFPYLTGHEIKMALYNTALDLGDTGEDNTYGMGLIDVWAAYQYLGPNSIEDSDEISLNTFTLFQNHPNPFNPTTTIKYNLKDHSYVKLSIYNTLGKKIRTLVDSKKLPGYKSVIWDGLNDNGEQVASGVYIYKLEVSNPSVSSGQRFVKSRKMIFMK